MKSAFVTITSPSTSTQVSTCEYPFPSQEINNKVFPLDLKRRISSEDTPLSNKIHVEGDTSPILVNYRKFKITKVMYNKTLPGFIDETIDTHFEDRRESPPFYGFDNSKKYSTNETIECETGNHKSINKKNMKDIKTNKTEIDQNGDTDDIRINGNLWIEDESYQHRLLQEQADLEFAKKLQEEYDRYAHYTRSSRKIGRGSRHRQTTLDHIFTGTYKVK